jgi:hypothetical protein
MFTYIFSGNIIHPVMTHFPFHSSEACHTVIRFSVGIYRQNTTSTISGVFIVYLATLHVSATYLATIRLY